MSQRGQQGGCASGAERGQAVPLAVVPVLRVTPGLLYVTLYVCASGPPSPGSSQLPSASRGLFSVSVSLDCFMFVFETPRVRGILRALSFSVWPASLRRAPSRPICSVAENTVPFSLVADWGSAACYRLPLPYPLIHQWTLRLCLYPGGCHRHLTSFLLSK